MVAASVLRRCVFVVVLPACGPSLDSAPGSQQTHEVECPPADAEGLSVRPPVRVRFVNDTAEAVVVLDHYRSFWPRYFDVEGVASGRSIHGPDDTCLPDPPSCEELMVDNIVDCEGIAVSGLPIYLPPGTTYAVEWTVDLLEVHALPPECAWDAMAHPCSVRVGAIAGEYSVRARSLRASTCDTSEWACRGDAPLADKACLLRETFWDPACREGPEGSSRWDGGPEIVLAFDAR